MRWLASSFNRESARDSPFERSSECAEKGKLLPRRASYLVTKSFLSLVSSIHTLKWLELPRTIGLVCRRKRLGERKLTVPPGENISGGTKSKKYYTSFHSQGLRSRISKLEGGKKERTRNNGGRQFFVSVFNFFPFIFHIFSFRLNTPNRL